MIFAGNAATKGPAHCLQAEMPGVVLKSLNSKLPTITADVKSDFVSIRF